VTLHRSARVAIPGPVLAELEQQGLHLVPTLDRVEELLHQQVSSSHAFMDRAARYLIDAGGKRFRPMLVALTSHLGDPDARHRRGWCHRGTGAPGHALPRRRDRRGARPPGSPSANARWDNTVAILTGDYLFARASELSADLGVEVTRIMARTLASLCEGQVLEVQGSEGALPDDVPRLEPTLDHYLRVLDGKTASLIATSCRYGALLSGCDDPVVEQVSDYGWNVGMAFQLSDDLLDIASDHEDSGKTPGTDLLEGVRTLPVLYAIEDDPDGELAALVRQGPMDPTDVPRALELLRGSAAMDRALDTARTYVDAANHHLDDLDDVPAVAALRRLAAYSLDRVG
jgi:heptaprenyl diphosphate synthase